MLKIKKSYYELQMLYFLKHCFAIWKNLVSHQNNVKKM